MAQLGPGIKSVDLLPGLGKVKILYNNLTYLIFPFYPWFYVLYLLELIMESPMGEWYENG